MRGETLKFVASCCLIWIRIRRVRPCTLSTDLFTFYLKNGVVRTSWHKPNANDLHSGVSHLRKVAPVPTDQDVGGDPGPVTTLWRS